jgi:DNA-binding PadR family transcriptional regulator
MARKQLQTLTEPMYYILLSLLEPLHGYGIMKNIEVLTKGRVAVGPGTLYSLISRFEKEGIVSRLATEDNRKTYVLTRDGREILQQEYERLRQLVVDGSALIGVNTDEKN